MAWLDLLFRDVVLLPLAGAAAVAWLFRPGRKARLTLRQSPRRQVALGAADLMVGLVLLFLGMLLAQWVFQRLGLSVQPSRPQDPATAIEGLIQPSPQQFLKQAFVGQMTVHFPVVVYVLLRAASQRKGLTGLGVAPFRLFRDTVVAARGLVLAVPMTLGLAVVMTVLGQWLLNQTPPQTGHEMLTVLRQSTQWPVTLGLLLSALVLAPLLEELVFRGLAQTAMLRMIGPSAHWEAVLIVSLVFAAMHGRQPWQVLPSLFLLSVVLGWLYERTGSLWPSILVHAGFNTVNVVLAMVFSMGG